MGSPRRLPSRAAADLIPSFERSLRARNRSPRTIRSYVESAPLLAVFLTERGTPTTAEDVRREDVEAFIGTSSLGGRPSTPASRYRYVQQFFRWLEDEGGSQRRRRLG